MTWRYGRVSWISLLRCLLRREKYVNYLLVVYSCRLCVSQLPQTPSLVRRPCTLVLPRGSAQVRQHLSIVIAVSILDEWRHLSSDFWWAVTNSKTSEEDEEEERKGFGNDSQGLGTYLDLLAKAVTRLDYFLYMWNVYSPVATCDDLSLLGSSQLATF